MLAPMSDRLVRKYNKTLQRTYPDCRVRWSERFEEWLLERKARYTRVNINPANYPKDAIDTFIQLRDGYYLAGRYDPVGPRSLPPVELLVKILLANDTARMDIPGATPEDRANAWCDRAEEVERAVVAKGREENSFAGSGVGGELYDQLAWAEGRRVAVPRSLPNE